MILFLKILAMLATAVFAVFGMRAEHGRVKALLRHFPFWAVITTTIISGGLLFYETNKAGQDAIDASNRIKSTAQQLDENLKTTKSVAEGIQKSLDALHGLEGDNRTISSNLGKNLDTSGIILTKQSTALSQQNELLKRQETTIANITGGNSFCYVSPGFLDHGVVFILNFVGEYAIRDVVVDIRDMDEPPSVTVQAGPGLMRSILPVAMPKIMTQLSVLDLKEKTEKRFSIDITSPYLKLGEHLFIAKVGEKWTTAYTVYERHTIIIPGKMKPPRVLKQCVDKEFPSSIQLPFTGNIRCKT